jgi:phosphatidylglycerophosphate synthase
VWLAVALMLDWHLGMVETEDGRPRALGPADALTLARVWLAPLALDGPAPWGVAVAGATDVLDGRLARATAPTRLGRDLEGLADAAFSAAALAGAVRGGRLPRTAAALELVRLGGGVAWATATWVASAARPDPRVLGAARLTTPVRAAGLLAAGLGRRRTAGALVAGGSLWSLIALARAAAQASGDGGR